MLSLQLRRQQLGGTAPLSVLDLMAGVPSFHCQSAERCRAACSCSCPPEYTVPVQRLLTHRFALARCACAVAGAGVRSMRYLQHCGADVWCNDVDASPLAHSTLVANLGQALAEVGQDVASSPEQPALPLLDQPAWDWHRQGGHNEPAARLTHEEASRQGPGWLACGLGSGVGAQTSGAEAEKAGHCTAPRLPESILPSYADQRI